MAKTMAELQQTIHSNAWKKLLKDEDINFNFEGFKAPDFHVLTRNGETEDTEDDMHQWLELNEEVEGHKILFDEEIVASVTGEESEASDDSRGEADDVSRVKVSHIRECADNLLKFVATCGDTDIVECYDHLCLHSKIIVRQHQVGNQTKIHS